MMSAEWRYLLTALLLLSPCAAGAVVLSGQVQAVDSQQIYTPESNSSPVVLRFYLPDGTRVKKGDVVLRIDAGNAAAQVRTLGAQVEQAQAKAAKELAELEVKAVDAELAVVDADAAYASAKLDAALPRGLISGLDYDRYQGELERTRREAVLRREELAAARAAITRRREDAVLEVRKLEVERDFNAAQVRTAEVRADRDGVVLHSFNNNWIGGRIDEGSSTMPGTKAGDIISGGAMRVRAWALEPDRAGLATGEPVALAFDALPGKQARGHITAIAGAPDRKPEWGEGRYIQVDIHLDDPASLPLLPGMSARVTAGVGTGARK